MKLPIPDAALDDRLGWFGTAGSGKTYNACSRVERLLDRKARVIIPDPLGVWWGLRLLEDGTRSPYNVVIFGGQHGDLPLTEHAGALIGETVAGMAESCILDLSELGTKAAERRFMLAFLTALYKHASGEPVHVVFDEADMWAPQKLLDKDGEAAKLLGMMETIVRRGRVKGFIPWLITQRPAVLSKDVLSQVDGLIAFKLTSSQDRNALGGWVEGQADAGDWKIIHADLPTLERGKGIVWLPGRGVLDAVAFPAKKTFDSSRTPKRGERKVTADLEPLDISKLRDRLAKVETEIKANDPRALKAQIADLTRQLQGTASSVPTAAPTGTSKVDLAAEYTRGREEGFDAGQEAALKQLGDIDDLLKKAEAVGAHNARIELAKELAMKARELEKMGVHDLAKAIDRLAASLEKLANVATRALPQSPVITKTATRQRPSVTPAPRAPAPNGKAAQIANQPRAEGVTPAQQKVLNGLAWLESIGIKPADKTQLALFIQVSPTSGGYFNNLGALRTAGLIEYPSGGTAALTDAGRQIAEAVNIPPTTADLHATIAGMLPPAKWKILAELIAAYPQPIAKDDLAQRIGVSPTSGGYFNNLGSLRSLGLIDYPTGGQAVAKPVLFLEGR